MNEKQIASQRFTIPHAIGRYRQWVFQLAHTAMRFESEIVIRWSDKIVDGKSILKLLPLCAQCGAIITVIARGTDACQALESIGTVFSPS